MALNKEGFGVETNNTQFSIDDVTIDSQQPLSSLGKRKCLGNIEAIDDGHVVGWLAGMDGKSFDGNPLLYLDDRLVGSISEFQHRKDLEAAGIASGLASFIVNCSHVLSPESREYKAQVVVEHEGDGIVILLEATLVNLSHQPLNPNMLLALGSNTSVKEWSVKCRGEAGLRLERYSSARPDNQIRHGYTRFAFIDTQHSLESMTLTCMLQMPATRLVKDLELGLCVRGDRYTNMSVRLLKNDVAIAESHAIVESFWSISALTLEKTAGLLPDSNARYELELTVYHTGRSYIDIGFVCLAERFSHANVKEHFHSLGTSMHSFDNPIDSETSYVQNGYFTQWSNGVTLGSIPTSRPLADGWFLQCRKSQRHLVSLALNAYENLNDKKSVNNPQSFGIRVVTGAFEGPVRLESFLDMRFLDQDSLVLTLDLASFDAGGVGDIKRLFLLGKSFDQESILHVISKKFRIRGSEERSFVLNASDMIKIRRSISNYGGIKLCIELEQNVDQMIKSVRLMPASEVREDTSLHALDSELVFEDPAINDQIDVVKGLASWSKPGIASPEELRVKDTNDADLTSSAVTQIYKPARTERAGYNYPSIDIVIPVHNALDAVSDCVKSVIEKTTVPYNLIIVDDCSDSATERYLLSVERSFPHVHRIRNSANEGYTKSVNRALRKATADLVCILNSDCIVTISWLERLVDCALSSEKAGMVGPLSNAASYQSMPQIFNQSGGWNYNPLPCSVAPDQMAELVYENAVASYPSVGVINGFCQIIKREVIDKVGLLDEESFPRGFGEENDYCVRVRKFGYDLLIATDAYVYHKKSQSFGHEARKILSDEGSQALKAKHPDVDWKTVVQSIEKAPELVTLRSKLTSIDL